MGSIKRLWVWLKEHFDTPDRRIGTSSFILSVLGVILAIISPQFPDKPELLVLRDIAIAAGLIALIVFVFIRYVLRGIAIQNQVQQVEQYKLQMDELREVYLNHLLYTHKVAHSCRDELFEKYFKFSVLQNPTEQEKGLFNKICSHVTFIVRQSFVEYFKSRGIDIGNDIAITIKLLVSPDDVLDAFNKLEDDKKQRIQKRGNLILTVYRDYYTWETKGDERKVGTLSEIERNTASHYVIDVQDPYFVCDDLQSLTSYSSQNEKWKEQYNATLVVPIRYDGGINQQIYYGILAVDSLNKQKINLYSYNKAECRHILFHAADLLATFFLLLALSKHKLSGATSSLSTTSD